MCRSRKPVYRQRYRGFESLPLRSQNPGHTGVFRVSGQLLWLSCTSMHVHACTCCVVWCAALIPGKSSSESPESPQNPRFSRGNRWFCSRGGRIRTSISNSTHITIQWRLPSHARSPSRSCLHLVLVPSSVIWYTDLHEIPISHRGLRPHKPMPMTGVPGDERERAITRILKHSPTRPPL